VTDTQTANPEIANPETADPQAQQDVPARDEGRLSTADISGAIRTPEPSAEAAQTAPTAPAAPAAETGSRMRTEDDARGAVPLFDDAAASDLRDRWTDVQTGFVDEPRSAVEAADSLVAEVMKRLADGFATERQALEQQWSRGDDVSTEDLRLALRRYRSFFDRLLKI
jgi:hypothetical protein